ncbi:multicopper oxidase family protein (plasmid) [Leisingera aquaemixtae]|uniref:Multicopper oxidase family protein n=1 Tax=Leisingera aquaemixtae TaxID=1396826 RepID=A0ABY5WR20_9RHOB|nr:multicopper oxidase family protein [Leisingera aquaemixtae]UWQ43950.1 multicopper oxidase family protein [Leisingera aquaemixtae]
MFSRRGFLTAAGAAGVLAELPVRGDALVPDMMELRATVKAVQLLPSDYPKTEIWGYSDGTPGPEIRVPQGGRVQRRFVNDLPQASTVHWHGIRAANSMDGVAGLTQAPVQPRGSFDYDFTVRDAGTYWYHAHNRSVEQVARGLHGPLIVDEKAPLDIDRDVTLVLDDWLLEPDGGQLNPDFETRRDRSHAGRLGNFISTNGQSAWARTVKRHERLRLRLINASNARIFLLALVNFEGWVMALDGMPLPAPKTVSGDLLLCPGQRADLLVDVTAGDGEEAFLARIEDNQGYAQAAFPVRGVSSSARRGSPAPLPPNPAMQVTGLNAARELRLDMAGGAMGSLRSAVLNGQNTGFQRMVEANQFWAFNGTVGMTQTPLATVARGETVRVTVSNDTAFPHAMHLHGMHFRTVNADGLMGHLRDTLLSFAGESHEIAFVADNPGDWAFHCHMLSHAASGMMTWIRVQA